MAIIGYEGTVTFTKGVLGGCSACQTGNWVFSSLKSQVCSPIPCLSPNYTGVAGACKCSEGYSGLTAYANGAATGCNKCNSGTWAPSGDNQQCVANSCSVKGYTGNDGACICDAGFFGNVVNTGNSLSGCNACGVGSWSVAGNHNICNPVSCVGDAYTGTSGLFSVYVVMYVFDLIL